MTPAGKAGQDEEKSHYQFYAFYDSGRCKTYNLENATQTGVNSLNVCKMTSFTFSVVANGWFNKYSKFS